MGGLTDLATPGVDEVAHADERGPGSALVDDTWFGSWGSQLVDPDDVMLGEQGEVAALRTAVLGAVGTLSAREAGIIMLRYGLGGVGPLTLQEIGVRYGVTRERIRQIETKSLERLRLPSVTETLREWAPDPPGPSA